MKRMKPLFLFEVRTRISSTIVEVYHIRADGYDLKYGLATFYQTIVDQDEHRQKIPIVSLPQIEGVRLLSLKDEYNSIQLFNTIYLPRQNEVIENIGSGAVESVYADNSSIGDVLNGGFAGETSDIFATNNNSLNPSEPSFQEQMNALYDDDVFNDSANNHNEKDDLPQLSNMENGHSDNTDDESEQVTHSDVGNSILPPDISEEEREQAMDIIKKRLSTDYSSSANERQVKSELQKELATNLTEYLAKTREKFNLDSFFKFFSERISSTYGATKEIIEVDICNMIMRREVPYQRFEHPEKLTILNKNKQTIRLHANSSPQEIYQFLLRSGAGDMTKVNTIDICVYLKKNLKR